LGVGDHLMLPLCGVETDVHCKKILKIQKIKIKNPKKIKK
jgi:hypothetical protein